MYMMVSGDRAELRGLNLEGMRRLGFSDLEVRNFSALNRMKEFHRLIHPLLVMQVKNIRRTYQKLFMNTDTEAGTLVDRLSDLVRIYLHSHESNSPPSFPSDAPINTLLSAAAGSKRGTRKRARRRGHAPLRPQLLRGEAQRNLRVSTLD